MRIDSIITLSGQELKEREWRKLFESLTFTVEQVEINAWQYHDGKDEVRISRGAWYLLPDREYAEFDDLRSRPSCDTFDLTFDLDAPGYDGQADALKAMFRQQQGQVIMPPGNGKTNIGIAFAATCGTRTLVVVHTRDLFKQWVDRVKSAAPGMKIGQISGSENTIGDITIAMVQTLVRYVRAGGKFWRRFGCLILDEAHHTAAQNWEWIVNACPAFYRFGLTATAKRSDDMHPLNRFLIGPVIYEMGFRSQVPIVIQPVTTGFRCSWGGSWRKLVDSLIADDGRNRAIADLVKQNLTGDHTCLVLSQEIKHLEAIAAHLPDNVLLLTGALTQKLRNKTVQALRDGKLRCVLATRLADEALDVPRLDRIFLTYPGKFEGTLIQRVGRGARQHEAKRNCIVYDFVDPHVTKLLDHWDERHAAYARMRKSDPKMISIERSIDYGKKRVDVNRKSLLDRLRERSRGVAGSSGDVGGSGS